MKIGAYEILQEIGRGGIGIVYKARDPVGREVAIKILQRLDAERLARFDRERRLLEKLTEAQGFVPLVDAGDSPIGPYLVMPFVKGGTLRARVRRGPLSAPETAALGLRIARALGHAHALGIVHRDLKPENVIFAQPSPEGGAGEPLLLDLGLAKHFRKEATEQSISLSKTGEALGTISYMAPEQAGDSKNVGPGADVFSLGAILYECLTGSPPFEGETSVEVWAKVQGGRYEPLRRRCPDAPRWLVEVIEIALEGDPKERYADGTALARALADEGRQGRRRVRWVALAGLGVFVALATLASLALVRGGAQPPGPRPSPVVVPPGPPAPPPPSPPPAPAKPLFDSKHLRVQAIWGKYAGRHAAMVQSVKFSPDGTLLASGGLDNTIRLWDATDLHEVRSWNAGAIVRGVEFSHDGKRLYASLNDKTVKTWEIATGRTEAPLEGHTDEIYNLAVSPDGKRGLSAGKDHKVGYWDLEAKTLIRFFEGHTGVLYGITFSPDGKLGVSAGADRTARIWDLEKGTLVRTLGGHEGDVNALAFSPDGWRLATGCKDGVTRLWDSTTGDLIRKFERHERWVVSLAFSRDGKKLLSGSFDNAWKVFIVETGETERTVDTGSWVVQASWSPDGKMVATAGNDTTVRLWDAATGRELGPSIGHRGRVMGVALSADGTVGATCGYDRVARIWDAAANQERAAIEGLLTSSSAVAISADGRQVLVGGGRDAKEGMLSELALVDVARDKVVVLTGHRLPVRAVSFAPNGRAAASAGWSSVRSEGEGLSWTFGDAPSGAVVKGANAGAFALIYAEPGRILAGTARGAELWDVDRGEVEPLGGDPRPVTALAHEGALTIAGGLKGHLLGYDATDPARTFPLGQLERPVVGVAIAPDHTLAVTATDDGVVRLVSLRSGEIDRVDLESIGDRPTGVAFYPDGRSFLVSTIRGVVLRFEVRN